MKYFIGLLSGTSVDNIDAALVGIGENSNGEYVGFAAEVKQGYGVLSSLIIEPHGIASQDKKAAHVARMDGKYMIDVLNQMAIQHRIKYPQ